MTASLQPRHCSSSFKAKVRARLQELSPSNLLPGPPAVLLSLPRLEMALAVAPWPPSLELTRLRACSSRAGTKSSCWPPSRLLHALCRSSHSATAPSQFLPALALFCPAVSLTPSPSFWKGHSPEFSTSGLLCQYMGGRGTVGALVTCGCSCYRNTPGRSCRHEEVGVLGWESWGPGRR